MASVTAQEIEQGLIDALIAGYELPAAKTEIESLIGSGEVDLQAAITNLLKNLPVAKGVAAIAITPIENMFVTAIEGYAAQLAAKYGSDALYALFDAYLHSLATKV